MISLSLTVQELPIKIFCGDIMPDGTVILGSNIDGTIFKSVDEITFTPVFTYPGTDHVKQIFCDSRGQIFAVFIGAGVDTTLFRSQDGGATFQPVLVAKGPINHPMMIEDLVGNLFAAEYGDPNPPNAYNRILRSMDGGNVGTWTEVYSDPASIRHFHALDVDIDITTGYIYALTGEPDGASYLMRSKDNGNSWTRIVEIGATLNLTPMGLCIHRGYVYFGRDNPGGSNSIYRIQDLGSNVDVNYPIQTVVEVTTAGPFIQWLRSTPNETFILAGNGYRIWVSESGNPGTWQILFDRGAGNAVFMFSHKWSRNGSLFVGGGLRPSSVGPRLPGLKVSLNNLHVLTIESSPIDGIPFTVTPQ